MKRFFLDAAFLMQDKSLSVTASETVLEQWVVCGSIQVY